MNYQKAAAEYLQTLDNDTNNEWWWCTERELAADYIEAFAAQLQAAQGDAVCVPRELADRLCHRDNYTRQTARRELRTLLEGDAQ